MAHFQVYLMASPEKFSQGVGSTPSRSPKRKQQLAEQQCTSGQGRQNPDPFVPGSVVMVVLISGTGSKASMM